jgi:hypothetical protein
VIYIIKGTTGEAYNGTLDEWTVGATESLEEAQGWVKKANEYLIQHSIHYTSKDTARGYKTRWTMWFDDEFRTTYNGAHYYWYGVPELDNRFDEGN